MRRACVLLVLFGCTRATPEARKDPASVAPAAAATIDAKYVDALKDVFRTYQSWSRVDDMARWAPTDCRAPPPMRAAMSDAGGGPHARKLYSLYARERGQYVALLGDAGAALEKKPQAIVKESYVVETVDTIPEKRAGNFDPYVKEGDKMYKAGAVAAVFVMLEQPEGWIYGTLTPTGEVTSAGHVAPCIACHEKAPHKPLFGPQPVRYF
jgi:hypothetical protein